MIVGTSLEAEGRVLEREDQDGGCSAAACAASSSAAQGLQGMLAAVQCASVSPAAMLVAVQCASARPAARFNASTTPHQVLASVLLDARLDFCGSEIKRPVSPRNRSQTRPAI